MFDLKRPCNNCPFRKDHGHFFQLGRRRIEDIVNGVAFQCHKTVDHSSPDWQGDHPQQCAGLIALLHKAGRVNQITQVAGRLINFDPSSIEGGDVYDTIEEAILAHEGNHHKGW